MLLNFDSNSFQSVPDVLRNNQAHNLPIQSPDIVLTNRPTLNKQHHQQQQQHLYSNANEVSEHTYPLDMQFPQNPTEKNDTKKQLKVTKASSPPPNTASTSAPSASNSKKRKQADSTQPAKASKQSLNSTITSNNNSEEDYDDDSDSDESSKRQRRLVKNREAAQMFRQRQKAYIQNLEKKVNDLNFENQQHRSKVELLTTENRLLADQLNYLRTFISGIISMNFPNGQQPPHIASLLHSFDTHHNLHNAHSSHNSHSPNSHLTSHQIPNIHNSVPQRNLDFSNNRMYSQIQHGKDKN